MSLASADEVEVSGPIDRLTPDLRQSLRDHKLDIVQLLAAHRVPEATPDMWEAVVRVLMEPEDRFQPCYVYPDGHVTPLDWWPMLNEEDRQYCRQPVAQRRCGWCGGINHHARGCCGVPVMPWGKHTDRRLSEISERYLSFALRKRFGSIEHRKLILAELQRRFVRYRSAQWESLAVE